MSIRRIQQERVLEEATRSLYTSGTKPTLNAIFNIVSRHFARNRVGAPLPLPQGVTQFRQQSNVAAFNLALLNMAENIDVLYEAMLEQVDDVLLLSSSLQAHVDRLKTMRRRIETTIDDYLLSLYDTDGYFYSISDTFADLVLTDLNLTSAYVDTVAGQVGIPAITAYSHQVQKQNITLTSVTSLVNGAIMPVSDLSGFGGAIEDDLDNTAWILEVDTAVPADVLLIAEISIGPAAGSLMSRIEIAPYGVSPVQALVETAAPGGSAFVPFGNRIAYTTDRIVLVNELRSIGKVRITFRKTSADYTVQEGNTTRYRYLFGAKTLAFYEQAYDISAQFVSESLGFHEDLSGEHAIDAVVLVVDEEKPPNTNIDYYLAVDDGGAISDINDLDWRPAVPMGASDVGSIIRFDGASMMTRTISSTSTTPNFPLLPIDTAAGDPSMRNPSQVIVPGQDIYRLCGFNEPVLLTSLKLEEGINTTRISYIPVLNVAATNSLSYWVEAFKSPNLRVKYARIDAGNEYFFGGDIGESNVSAFVETYIESDIDRPTFLSEFSKTDVNSQQWDVRVLLNGREIGNLPVGTHRSLLPWTLRKDVLNHVILLVNIPTGTSVGTLRLMGDNSLFDFGTVKLATWSYVDFFDLQHNQAGEPATFSFFEEEIVTRKKPTDNFRFRYALPTGNGPTNLRFRADLSRHDNNPSITPRLNSYRLRFSYGS